MYSNAADEVGWVRGSGVTAISAMIALKNPYGVTLDNTPFCIKVEATERV